MLLLTFGLLGLIPLTDCYECSLTVVAGALCVAVLRGIMYSQRSFISAQHNHTLDPYCSRILITRPSHDGHVITSESVDDSNLRDRCEQRRGAAASNGEQRARSDVNIYSECET